MGIKFTPIQSGGGSVIVTATDLDIRDLDQAQDDVKVYGDVGVLDQIDLANSNPAAVAIVDAAGDQITSFGSGVEYTEGDTDASIIGKAFLWEDTADTLRAVSAAKPLPISVATIPSHAVTNAGTFVVQENGAALTSLQLADDVVYTDDTSTHATGTSKGTGIMAVATPTDAAVDANDIGMLAMTLARALKSDVTTIAGTAPTTAGKIDVKGADGDVFVRQATASNLNMTEASAASIKTAVETIDNFISGSRGLVTEDNSAAIKTSVEIMDDWDESDRAKVNPIAGQAGVQGNTGTVNALTQRVVLATDVQLPKSNELANYIASANLTVTNLNSLAASATYIAGWQSAIIDNSSNKYEDYRITAQLTAASSNNQAGFAFMFLVGLLDDSTWPAGFGTGEGTVTPTGGASIINAICRPAAAIAIDNSAGRIYYMDCPSVKQVFGGQMPSKFVIYITGNATTTTTAQFASSGNQVTYKASHLTVGA